MFSIGLKLLQRIPHSDSEELKKYYAEAVKKLKEWLDLLQKQFGTFDAQSLEEYYNLPMLWFHKVGLLFNENGIF